MIGATRPTADDGANYAYVAALRMTEGETRLEALMPVVLDLYQSYVDRVMATGGAVPHGFSDADHDILKSNADYLRRRYFGSLRGAILAAGPTNKCPYCYQFRASQVDHYLPKAHFGEYAIYASNLVPICGKCNGIKLNRYQRSGGGRRYLHPYFDQLPMNSTPFIAAKLSIGSSVIITFHIVRSPEMSDELWDVLSTHFTDLDLGTRYMEEATETMMTMLSSFYTHFARGGAEEVHDQLTIEKRSKENWYGPNHWWPVTLGVLAESQEFCDSGFKILGPDPEL